MSVLSTISSALLFAVSAVTMVTAAGCGTDAKGVDDCRSIEDARCTAAKNCNNLSVSVSECQNYYRDQCLHGLAVSPPSSSAIKACVATLQKAGQCALEGADTAPSACMTPPSIGTTAKTTCEIVTNPEETEECAFLLPNADAGSTASGGSGGRGGSGGSAGAAGSNDSANAGGAAGASQ